MENKTSTNSNGVLLDSNFPSSDSDSLQPEVEPLVSLIDAQQLLTIVSFRGSLLYLLFDSFVEGRGDFAVTYPLNANGMETSDSDVFIELAKSYAHFKYFLHSLFNL